MGSTITSSKAPSPITASNSKGKTIRISQTGTTMIQQFKEQTPILDNDFIRRYPKFNDDYPLKVNTLINYSLKNNIKMDVRCMQPTVTLQANESQTLSGIVTLSATEIQDQAKFVRVGIDLICLVDISSSMKGEKIEQTKATLKTLTSFLTSQDRLCIVLFNHEAFRLCPLIIMNDQNRSKLQDQISQISANGCTSMGAGAELVFKTIKDRKVVNNVTSVFILSDGQDKLASIDIGEQLKFVQDHVFTIHTFGCGEDIDEEMMSDLAQMKGGSFNYIKNPRIMDQCFIEVLGGLMSVVAEDIIIDLICQPQLKDIKIKNTYGDMWEECIQGTKYQIKIPQFSAGWNRAYVFTLSIPAVNKFTHFSKVQKILSVSATMKNSKNKQESKFEAQCQLTFYSVKEVSPMIKYDELVQIEYLRAQGAQLILEARNQCQNNQFQEAQSLLENIIDTIKSSPAQVLKASEQLCKELFLCKNACRKATFQEYGQKQLHQFAMRNLRQIGLTSVIDARGIQSYKISQNSNEMQRKLVLAYQN